LLAKDEAGMATARAERMEGHDLIETKGKIHSA
jgi:hypothetical protein